MDEIDKIYELLDSIQVTEDNKEMIDNIKSDLISGNIIGALQNLKLLQQQGYQTKAEREQEEIQEKIMEENSMIIRKTYQVMN